MNKKVKSLITDYTVIFAIIVFNVICGMVLFNRMENTLLQQTITSNNNVHQDGVIGNIVADTIPEMEVSLDTEVAEEPITITLSMYDCETGEPMYEFPKYMDEDIIGNVNEWIYGFAESNNYSDIRVIECCYDPWEDGVSIHFTFDNTRYMCIWFDMKADGHLTLYDKEIDELFWACYYEI